jgi:dTDP-4-amino-4,6-dideoxygalactose transaminase
VFCPAFTFSATAEAVALVGATPVFVDVLEATFNLDRASLTRGDRTARRLELSPKAVMAVDLFGCRPTTTRIGGSPQRTIST